MFWRKLMDRAAGEHSDAAAAVEGTAPADAPAAGPEPAAPETPVAPSAPAEAAPRPEALEAAVIDALSTVFDPEIPVNIYELGLIYDLEIAAGRVKVNMTLTSPACPVAGSLPGEVESKVREVDGVTDVEVELVWDPPWTPDRMSEAARLELGFM